MTAANCKTRRRDRSIPPPVSFDVSALPGDALLTAREVASWLRLAVVTLESWRLRRPGHGPKWIIIAGGRVRYSAASVRDWMTRDWSTTGASLSQSTHRETQNTA